jgi:hypothetical protein
LLVSTISSVSPPAPECCNWVTTLPTSAAAVNPQSFNYRDNKYP